VKRLAVFMVATAVASAIAWTSLGGIRAASGQTPGTSEIHRAHAGSYEPDPTRTLFILVLGSDSGAPEYARGGAADRGRSDSIHIVAINPDGSASIVGIPRDSYVPIPGHGTNKINAAMAFGGPALTIATIEAMSGIHFDYYMLTNFDDFVRAANEFGGLTVRVPFNMHDADSQTNFDAGVRYLGGHNLLGFTRNRHNAPHGDFDRSLNQGQVLADMQAEARRRAQKDPTLILSFVRILGRHIETDIPFAERVRLGLFALHVDPAKVRNIVLSGSGGTRGGASVVLLDSTAYAMLHDVADDGHLEHF
jgi:LCP family protein required for cell wall assembly